LKRDQSQQIGRTQHDESSARIERACTGNGAAANVTAVCRAGSNHSPDDADQMFASLPTL
jgi:hypothetical protein